MSLETKEIFEFSGFRLDVNERTIVRIDGENNGSLPEKAFNVLAHLVRRRGHLVTKDELLESVWPEAVVEEGNLDKRIHALRQFLGESPKNKFIETVRKHGYRFVADVEVIEVSRSWLSEAPGLRVAEESPSGPMQDSPEPKEKTSPVTDQIPTKRSSRVWVLAAGLCFVGVVLIALLAFDVGGLRGRLFADAGSVRIRSIAVLPFENLSGDTSQEYLVDGMTEALITDLARVKSLKVIARPAVMQYKGVHKPLDVVARELNVDAVLTGSVLRAGDRVRFSVQMTAADQDGNLWAESFERPLSDLFALQKEVARGVINHVSVNLTTQEQTLFGKAGSVNAAAFDDYLRGKFYLHTHTEESNAAAVTALENAIAADPGFAAAHAELAQAYVWKLFLFTPNDKQLAEKAFVEAEKALSLDPDLAVAYLARGRLLWTPANKFPHDQAIREYRRALELDPNLDEARNQLALVYCHISAFDDALKELELALAANPSNSQARFRVGETLLFQGKFEQALTQLRNTPTEANPALIGHQIVWALLNLGRNAEAAAALEQFLKENPQDNRGLITSQLAVLAAQGGRNEEAEAYIRSAIENGRGFGHFHHTAFHIACAYALMDKRDEAINWLENAANDGFPCYAMFEKEKFLENLRGEARFQALMETLRQRWGSYQAGPQ